MVPHGLLLVRKPTSMTSHDVVSFVRRALKTKEVGHSGTLDPLASGLMVLLIGEGTKISDYILNGNKGYRVKARLGIQTDSLDITGAVLAQRPVHSSRDEMIRAAEGLQGEFVWPVPLFSAVRQDGRKLYEFAHQGALPPEIPQRPMRFWGVQTLAVGSDYYEAHIYCSKGSFIRTWVGQLGERLGCGATVAELERTHSAPYDVCGALELETLASEYDAQSASWKRAFIPLSATLADWKTVTVRGKDEKLIYNGQISYDLERRLIAEQKASYAKGETVGIRVVGAEDGRLLAILESRPNSRLKIRRVFKRT